MDPLVQYRMPEWFSRLALLWYGVCLGVPAGFLLAMALGGYNAVTLMWALVVILLSGVMATLPSVLEGYIEHRNRIRGLTDAREKMEESVRQSGSR